MGGAPIRPTQEPPPEPSDPGSARDLMDDRRALGRRGEDLAAAHLTARGCTILAANWRPAGTGLRGEIDLVVQDGPALVFVEVRTRRGALPGRAEELVTPAKQARLIALAETYLQAQDWPADGTDWRIDVVTVWVRPGGAPVLTWLRGVVERASAVAKRPLVWYTLTYQRLRRNRLAAPG